MGSSASKATKAATGAAARKYPSRPSEPSSRTPPSQAQPSQPPSSRPSAPSKDELSPGPTVHPRPQASSTRSQEINLDASDPDFAASLRKLGPVRPAPTYSESSTFDPRNPSSYPSSSQVSSGGLAIPGQGQGQGFGKGFGQKQPIGPDPRKNPALLVLEARDKIQAAADKEFMEAGLRGHAGREFLDANLIRQVIVSRDVRRQQPEEIERRLGLRKGVVARLGAKGIVSVPGDLG